MPWVTFSTMPCTSLMSKRKANRGLERIGAQSIARRDKLSF
jgi:hypothetical protein